MNTRITKFNSPYQSKKGLTPTLKAKILRLFRAGKKDHEIPRILNISHNSFTKWKYSNVLNLRSDIAIARREHLLEKTDDVFEEAINVNYRNMGINKKGEPYIYKDAALLRVKLDAAKDIRQTLGKDTFSKRLEITGKNGAALMGNILDQIEAMPILLNGDEPTDLSEKENVD